MNREVNFFIALFFNKEQISKEKSSEWAVSTESQKHISVVYCHQIPCSSPGIQQGSRSNVVSHLGIVRETEFLLSLRSVGGIVTKIRLVQALNGDEQILLAF